ncbi:hypothetical protein PBOR_17070 [Paenibacillus borealis]|uniref:Uncharacterized protein n=1 Tax=Paenibacillus borealis TaxID=160799 RepID=A0A089MPP9_PAEBO|nr:hypothetical protein PBOR_17070 [Paenibacillus borealis]
MNTFGHQLNGPFNLLAIMIGSVEEPDAGRFLNNCMISNCCNILKILLVYIDEYTVFIGII